MKSDVGAVHGASRDIAAGAVSRFNMGLVIASGLSIGTLFTLFVVPAFYLALGADHSVKSVTSGQGNVSSSKCLPPLENAPAE
jgi:hypothetical protein